MKPNRVKPDSWKPDIENLYKILRREKAERPVLFELFMHKELYENIIGRTMDELHTMDHLKGVVDAFATVGYDYATTYASSYSFPAGEQRRIKTVSQNEGAVISDEESFEAYNWLDPDDFDHSNLKEIEGYLPDGMKLMVMGPGGVLENAVQLIGYQNMCLMLYEDPELLKQIVDNIGERIVRYYENALEFDSVGIIMSNDDWGFKTQTFLRPEHMREYIFPWHKKIVDVSHAAGRPVLLHSCGYFDDVMGDVIDMGYDGKHSYEDTILPVELSYDKWHDSIAILGGIDVDFIIRSSEDKVTQRCHDMLVHTQEKGGWALGSGNSIPDYFPDDKYFTMISAAYDFVR